MVKEPCAVVNQVNYHDSYSKLFVRTELTIDGKLVRQVTKTIALKVNKYGFTHKSICCCDQAGGKKNVVSDCYTFFLCVMFYVVMEAYDQDEKFL